MSEVDRASLDEFLRWAKRRRAQVGDPVAAVVHQAVEVLVAEFLAQRKASPGPIGRHLRLIRGHGANPPSAAELRSRHRHPAGKGLLGAPDAPARLHFARAERPDGL